MTRRLYHDDAYLIRFTARIVDRGCDPCEVYLDQTAFYPTSGGQPYDLGTIAGVPVIDVYEAGDRIQHRIARPVNTEEVECELDWKRRFDHMQQHSGQHLLSAVFSELFEAHTVSCHIGAQSSTVDLDIPGLAPEQIRAVEERVNDLVFENRAMGVAYEDASRAEGLRKESNREGVLRIVTIEGCDRSACGGTHVRATGEIGPVMIRKLDRIRGNVRVEFLCGRRAVARARTDFKGLSECARVFSATLDDAPGLVSSQHQKLAEADKDRKRLQREIAAARGRELYGETAPGEKGLRLAVRRVAGGPLSDALRGEAQGFTAGSKAVFLALSPAPPAVLLAASEDSGIDAGKALKEALSAVGGRGGGNARAAQGSLPSKDAVSELERLLENAL